MKNHHFRYIISLTILAILPEIYFLSQMPMQKIVLSFVIAVVSGLFIMTTDFGTTKGSGTSSRKWIWDFNSNDILGLKISNLPIEEFLFPLVWVPLPIALWEYVKSVNISNGGLGVILIGTLILAFVIFPLIERPHTKQ
ncbi:MAG: lycopene cyclase domain-containing protein [Candidatus Pacebacteria bacterium]|nr:lycopene cyclase domain-containing protein [Candidatus Paceibacterota bacterium]